MDVQRCYRAFTIPAVLAVFLVAAIAAAAANRSQNEPESSIVSCSSDDMRRNFCHIGQHSRVRVVRQRSQAACERNQSWGVSGERLWVDHGCRADFEVLRGRGRGEGRWRRPDGTIVVSCASNDMRRRWCDVGPNRGVRLVELHSKAKCELNRTYGVSGDRMWVDRGCRGDFEVAVAPAPEVYTVACASNNMRRNTCNIGRHSNVRLVKRHSDAACIPGRSWGVSGDSIWVDRGCRAEFEVTGRERPRRGGY